MSGEHEFNGYPARTLDSEWDDWKIGDKIVWEDEPLMLYPFEITYREYGFVWWHEASDGKPCQGYPCTRGSHEHMTRETNMLRIRE